ncbi:MAG: hypothetical protein WA414_14735, partial [Acidobacteriaceae bacterium]
LLIREVVRRMGLGWSRILVLGAAYTLVEEGFTTMSLFNPDYLKLHGHFLSHAFIPALGMGGWWTLFMFNLHTFWSISVSIALVEGLFPAATQKPWLGRVGDSLVAGLFLVGCALGTLITLKGDKFVASHMQLGATALVVVVLVLLALWMPRRSQVTSSGAVPSPWETGAMALVLGLIVLVIPPVANWIAVAVMLGIDVGFLFVLHALQRRAGWTALHTLSLGAGGACAYGLHAFLAPPLYGGHPIWLLRLGNAIFLLAAVGVAAAGAKRTARSLQPAEQAAMDHA